MSKKKKQTMTIVILCVLLVAAGIGYYGAGVHQKKKAAKEAAQEDKEITLYSLKADDLVSMHVVSDKADMTYTKENGVRGISPRNCGKSFAGDWKAGRRSTIS